MMEITDRKRRVLQAIVEDYVATAEPVGSRTLSRRYGLGVSPATIRNEMADLEEMGYLEQPHTSAGRIPSDKGYRFYVDSLMQAAEISREEAIRIQKIYEMKARELDSLIHLTVKLLSETTNYASLMLGPQLSRTRLSSLKIVPLDEHKGLLVIVTDAGFVENRVIELPEGLNPSELNRFSRVISERLAGLPLTQIGRSMIREIQLELFKYREMLDRTLELLRYALESVEENRVYLSGAANILNQPEFRDLDKVRMVLGVLENERAVYELLSEPGNGEGIRVVIGEENKYREIQDCSLVTATYYVGSRKIGRIGVLGPKRMEYARVIAVLDFITQNLSDVLTRYMK